MGSPTQRSLAYLRKNEWIAQIVEKYIFFAKVRQDLFGIIDLVAIKPGIILGVQTTTAGHIPDHIDKAYAEPRLMNWLEAGGVFNIHGWSKKGKKGKQKRWSIRVVKFSILKGKVVSWES